MHETNRKRSELYKDVRRNAKYEEVLHLQNLIGMLYVKIKAETLHNTVAAFSRLLWLLHVLIIWLLDL